MPKNVIIVGMARSGTSLTASIFARNGYFVAANPETELRKANKNNPGGYWEPQIVKDANVEILHAAGFEHHNTWTEDEIRADQAAAINALAQRSTHTQILTDYGKNRPWVWKDPRFCYTLGYWWPLIDPKTTAVLLLTRDPAEILRSFLRINWRKNLAANKDDFLRRVNDHLSAVRTCIKRLSIPHIEIDYSDYSSQPEATAEALGDFFGISLTANDLGYNARYNHSSSHGYLEYCVDKIVASVPESPRRLVKKIAPDFLKRALLPSRIGQ